MNKLHIVSLLLATVLASCGSKKDGATDAQKSDTLPVNVLKVESTEKNQTINISGTIEPEKSVDLAFAVSGKVASVLTDEGQNVRAGQLIATLDSRDYEYQLQQAEGSLMNAKDTYERDKQLYEKGSLTPQEYVQAQSQYVTAQGNRNSAAKKVSDTRLYASINGTVTKKQVEKGAQVTQNSPAFSVQGIDRVNVTMTIPEADIGSVMRNNTADVSIPALHKTFTAKVSTINQAADRQSNTFRTKMLIDNPHHAVLPGMIAEVNLITANRQEFILVPPKSVVHDEDGLQYVFLLDSTLRRAIRTRITTGQFFGDKVSVNEGVKTGDVLVLEGQQRLKDGQNVVIR